MSGPHATPLIRPHETAALVAEAAAGGVTLFDTAPFYGNGEAERRLAAGLDRSGARSPAILTKAGTVWRRPGRAEKDFSPDAVRRSLEASRARLGGRALAAVILHGPAPAQLTDALLHALDDLRAAGVVAGVGVAGRGAELDVAIASGGIQILMAPIGPDVEQADLDRLRRARGAGLGVVGIEIMGGAATGGGIGRSDLWRLARRAAGRRAAPPGDPSARLRAALIGDVCDVALTTTTRLAHLRANLDVVAALDFAGGRS